MSCKNYIYVETRLFPAGHCVNASLQHADFTNDLGLLYSQNCHSEPSLNEVFPKGRIPT